MAEPLIKCDGVIERFTPERKFSPQEEAVLRAFEKDLIDIAYDVEEIFPRSRQKTNVLRHLEEANIWLRRCMNENGLVK